MQVNINGHECRIIWRYQSTTLTNWLKELGMEEREFSTLKYKEKLEILSPLMERDGFQQIPLPDITSCLIQKLIENNWETLSTGVIKKHFRDADNKPLARKLSLTRALSIFNKEQRTAFWNTFVKTCVDKKPKLAKVVEINAIPTEHVHTD